MPVDTAPHAHRRHYGGPMTSDAADVARRCAEAMYARDEAARHLGIEVTGVGPGRALTRMTVAPWMVNGHGIAHGGYLFLLADTAFAYACNTYDLVTVAAAADVVFTAPARAGDVLVAEAVERTRFGRGAVYDVTVRGPGGTVIAEFRGRSLSRDEPVLPRPDQG